MTELRESFYHETVLRRMTSSDPPVIVNIIERETRDGRVYYEYDAREDPPDKVGQNLSAELVGLIGSVQADGASYGPRHPVRRALTEWERFCRRHHRGPGWLDHGATPALCSVLLREEVERGASAIWCADEFHLTYGRTERLLSMGRRFVNERLARWAEDQYGLLHDKASCEMCRIEAAVTAAQG